MKFSHTAIISDPLPLVDPITDLVQSTVQGGAVLARQWGHRGKGDNPEYWPEPFPQQYPQLVSAA